MKKMGMLLCCLVLLLFSGCAAQPEESGEALDIRPVEFYANECFGEKMERDNVTHYAVTEVSVSARSGDDGTFRAQYDYTVGEEEKQYYCIIAVEVEDDLYTCTLLEEGETG